MWVGLIFEHSLKRREAMRVLVKVASYYTYGSLNKQCQMGLMELILSLQACYLHNR
jgi:hypothetical protein